MTLIAVVGLAVTVLPTTIVLGFGLIPGVVAYITDQHPERYLARCVGYANLAGVAPLLERLWRQGHEVEYALALLGDVFAWFTVYGAAAIGWALYLWLPPVVKGARKLLAQARIERLRQAQAKLVKEWGESIATPNKPPPEPDLNATLDGASSLTSQSPADSVG